MAETQAGIGTGIGTGALDVVTSGRLESPAIRLHDGRRELLGDA